MVGYDGSSRSRGRPPYDPSSVRIRVGNSCFAADGGSSGNIRNGSTSGIGRGDGNGDAGGDDGPAGGGVGDSTCMVVADSIFGEVLRTSTGWERVIVVSDESVVGKVVVGNRPTGMVDYGGAIRYRTRGASSDGGRGGEGRRIREGEEGADSGKKEGVKNGIHCRE